MNLTFNPAYVMKVDKGAVLLLPKENLLVDSKDTSSEGGFYIKVHSIHAAILSFFDGRDENEAISNAAAFLNIDPRFIKTFIEKITDNEERVGMVHKDVLVAFPKKCLIRTDRKRTENYDPSTFDYGEPFLKLRRHLTPTDLTFMLTTRCATDCIYCYADRRKIIDSQVPLERYKELIAEARQLQVRAIDVIGGEFFLYKHWRELLVNLKEHDYSPYISTKVPLSEDEIIDLKNIGIKGLQVSLDTLIAPHQSEILQVKEKYTAKIKNTLRLLDKHGIKTFVHTIMTSKNDNIEDMLSIYDFLKTLGNIDYWRLDKASLSLYKKYREAYPLIKSRTENTDKIMDFMKDLRVRDNPPFDIRDSGIETSIVETDKVLRNKNKADRFEGRSLCTANFSSLFVLPDGQVTICEELYWTPKFIIGNVLKQGIEEIWNSEAALDQFYIRQEEFPADSACSKCKDFEECRRGRGVCHRDIMKAYGEDKWYYPDRNCPKSPEELFEIM